MHSNTKTFKNNITSIGFIFFSVLSVSAQEIGININGGISGLYYQVPNGFTKKDYGETFGVYFTRHFDNSNWGITSGINVHYFINQSGVQDNRIYSTYLVDNYNSAFEYHVSAINYKEQQKFLAFTVPLLISFEKNAFKNAKW